METQLLISISQNSQSLKKLFSRYWQIIQLHEQLIFNLTTEKINHLKNQCISRDS